MTESSTPPAPAAFSYPGHGPNARTGVAICHGFTGSPLSVLPWARHLAAQGFAVSVPLLPGHGTHWRDLAWQGWQDWYRSFETAYLDLAARTDDCYVAGLSMGGTIALRTAARHGVAGVAAVNPGLSFYDRRVRIVGLLKSDTDAVVPPSSLALLRRRLGSRELTVVPLPHSGHVATLDADAPLLFEESVRFFLQHAHASSPPRAPSETP